MSEVMPVDVWPRAAEALELWTENGLTVEFLEGMSYNHRVALMAAARWGLEAQQRGVEAHLSSEPLDIDGLMWRVTVPHVLGSYMEGPHLLVPLEAMSGPTPRKGSVLELLKAQRGPDCRPAPTFGDYETESWFGECSGCEWVGPERVTQYDAVKDWERWHDPEASDA